MEVRRTKIQLGLNLLISCSWSFGELESFHQLGEKGNVIGGGCLACGRCRWSIIDTIAGLGLLEGIVELL